jgi:hypothetical protein
MIEPPVVEDHRSDKHDVKTQFEYTPVAGFQECSFLGIGPVKLVA